MRDLCVLVIVLTTVFQSDNKCIYLINEVNSDTPKKLDQAEFIEIKVIPTQTNEECHVDSSFKVIFLKGLSKGKGAEIHFYASLNEKSFSTRGEKFYLLGSAGGKGVLQGTKMDQTFDESNVYSRKKFQGKQQMTLFDVMSNGNVYPEAVLLLRVLATGGAARDFHNTLQLGRYKLSVKIDNDLKAKLKEYVLDGVVYARRSVYTSCSIYEEIIPKFRDMESSYVLTDYDYEESRDNSLNRCTELTDPFMPETFKLGLPTPGSENDCSGPRFILSEIIAQAAAASVAVPLTEPSTLFEISRMLFSKSFNFQ